MGKVIFGERGEKKCGEYKKKNWVGILDLINIGRAIFGEKKW